MNNLEIPEEKWPSVLPNDEGVAPYIAYIEGGDLKWGSLNQCHFCHQKIGEKHKRDCVTIKKLVKVRYTFDIEIEVPHCFTKENLEFRWDGSSWCADNAIEELEAFAEKEGCLCNCFSGEFLEIIDNTPIQHLRKEHVDDNSKV